MRSTRLNELPVDKDELKPKVRQAWGRKELKENM